MTDNAFFTSLDFIFHTRFLERFKSLKIFDEIEKLQKGGDQNQMDIRNYLAEIGLLRELASLKEEFDKPNNVELIKQDEILASCYQMVKKSHDFLQEHYAELVAKQDIPARFLYDQTNTHKQVNRDSLYQLFTSLVSDPLHQESVKKPKP